MDFKTRPFKHQRECFEEAKERPFYGLLLSPGLGKTKITIDIVTYRKTIRTPYRTLVVCPNTIIHNWEEEVTIHSDLTSVPLVGPRAKRLQLLEKDADIYIINYESAKLLVPELVKKGFQFLVFDESQALANPKSQQSKAAYELSKHIKHKLILTGTPVMNTPLDLFGQMRVLNDQLLGGNFYRFRAQHAIMGGYMNKQIVKYYNMDRLKDKVYSCAKRLTKEECLDLPDKLYQVIRVPMEAPQLKAYNELKAAFITEFRNNFITAPVMLTRMLRFSQITAGFIKDTEGEEHVFHDNPKVNWLCGFLNELDPTNKVVVFCRFTKEIDVVSKTLSKINVSHAVLDGRSKERQQIINGFNEDTDTRVIIVQAQTGGVGINLTSASYCVFMSNLYSYGKRVQAEDRIHRIGQVKNCTYIDVVCESTIDEAVLNAIRKKESLSNMITDDLVRMI